jgi:ABC-type sugar transport system permease subunit
VSGGSSRVSASASHDATLLPAARLAVRDRTVLGLVVAIPVALHVALVWLPALASVGLSFTDWNGIGGLAAIRFVGLDNYARLLDGYPAFWSAVVHNAIWLVVFVGIATPIGMALAVLIDREVRGVGFYQTAFYLPVVLSLALVGLIWELQYAPDRGVIDQLLGRTGADAIDWLGDRRLNLWAVLVAAGWRHAGYVMILYLAGLRTVDPALRDAAAVDGADARQTFFRVVFPVLAPINVIVVVVTVIESLRAFDIVYVINRGMNGLELLSVLVTNNIVGEASRLGFGSAIATILLLVSVGPIVVFLRRVSTRVGR